MSVSRRSSPSTPQLLASTHDLKHRVITCLNKLSDRDTIALATIELESIARTLNDESFSPFISCIYNTDASSKSPVRKQCVLLLSFLSRSHGDALSPFLSKMVSTVVRRLHDSDSAVRSACVDAITAMSSQVTKPPFSYFLKPLMESLTIEQDINSQIGSALCLAAAIEASANPEVAQLRRILPRLGKLVNSEGFKAKAALLVLIGSVVGVGAASSREMLDWLVPCVAELLSSEDWAVRKAAAETLGRVASAEKGLAAAFKASCVSSLESRRFDKIKVVRKTMNQTLELWKEIPDPLEEVSPPSISRSPSTENGSSGCFPHVTKKSNNVNVKAPLKKIVHTERSPSSAISSVISSQKSSTTPADINCSSSKPMFSKLENRRPSGEKIETSCEGDDTKRSGSRRALNFEENRSSEDLISEKEVAPLSSIVDDKVEKHRKLRSGSRVVPFEDDDEIHENPESGVVLLSSGSDEIFDSHKEVEDLSLIRNQLLQIENQQSSLLDLLQRFIGNSQSGMNALETRVNGLEVALDEMSYNLALSSGRLPNSDFAENKCCKLPGTEFLSSKFWRRTDKEDGAELHKLDSRIFHPQSRARPARNSYPDLCGNIARGNHEQCLKRVEKSLSQGDEGIQVCKSSGSVNGVLSIQNHRRS